MSSTQQQEEQESIRYQKLQSVIDKALSEARKSFDTSQAIDECYGDDAAIFGKSTLTTLLDSLVDRINTDAKEESLKYMQEQGVEEKLKHVESIIATLENLQQRKEQAEAKDVQAATDALTKAKLPKNMSPDDIVSHQAFLIMEKERNALQEEIAAIQAETKLMEEQINKAQANIQQGLSKVEETGEKLGQTADACSFVS